MGHLVLVGMMGSGKTSVGELVAERLGRKLVDSDAVIEARTGRTVREIFEADGEAAFRTLESEALAEALASPQPAVVAAAGGVVLDEANRELLRSGGGRRVVWLDADPSVLAARVEKGDHRPLLGDDPEAAMVRLDRERRPLYREVADHRVDVSGQDLAEVAEAVLALVPA
ncbi:MAG: shikimate kinase [Actinomycetota bacterium]|nr:shikimate kinase [Actinomycetota bacterium]